MSREYGEEEVARLMNEIMKNHAMMLKLQKQIVELQVVEEEKKKKQRRRQKEREQERREYEERWEKEEQRRQKEKEEVEKRKRVDEEWRKMEEMRVQEERRAEKEWIQQEMWERRREENRQRVMEERKCIACRRFGHMAYNCRNMREEQLIQVSSNIFEVLKVKVMQREEGSSKEVAKDRKEILREERAKKGVEGRQTKVERKEKKEKYLREVIVKIGLKQEEEEEGVVTEALLNSGAMGLVMSEEFARRHKFKRIKLERPVYVRNVNGMLNYAGPIVDTVEVEIFFKGHKERMSIDVIGGQKWSVILVMPWLGCYNSEIDWKTGEVKITRCPDKCGKKWRVGKQIKPGWKK